LPTLFPYASASESFPSVPARVGITACTTEPPLEDSTRIFPPNSASLPHSPQTDAGRRTAAKSGQNLERNSFSIVRNRQGNVPIIANDSNMDGAGVGVAVDIG
jgi:hypothetical protein